MAFCFEHWCDRGFCDEKHGKCLICRKRSPRPDDDFCQPCVDEVMTTAPDTDDEDEGFDCRNYPN